MKALRVHEWDLEEHEQHCKQVKGRNKGQVPVLEKLTNRHVGFGIIVSIGLGLGLGLEQGMG